MGDDLCEDWSTARPWKITYRKDTEKNLETYYDRRVVKFRRRSLSASAWTDSTFAKWDLVTDPTTSDIYVVIRNISIPTWIEPHLDTNYWMKWLETSTTPYLSWTNNKTSFKIFVNTTNLTINAVDYIDVPTFSLMDNLTITDGWDMHDIYVWKNTKNDYNNTIILSVNLASSLDIYNVELWLNNEKNTFFAKKQNIKVWDNFYENILFWENINLDIWNWNYQNIFNWIIENTSLWNAIYLNLFSNWVLNNTIWNYVYKNYIWSSMTNNSVLWIFHDNVIWNWFTDNEIKNNFSNNDILDNFQQVTVCANCSISKTYNLGAKVYGNYTKRTFVSEIWQVKMNYFDAGGNPTVVNVTD